MSSTTILSDSSASRITRVEELAYELTIAEVMTRNPITLDINASMRDALDVIGKAKISGAPVTRDGKLIGILSVEDLIRSLRDGRIERKVTLYMTQNVITVHEYDQVVEALKIFASTKVGRLPVVDAHNNLIGILTKGDISNGVLKALQNDIEAEELIRYRASHLFEDIVSDRTSLILRYAIKKGDFLHGGAASNRIKKALLRLGASNQIARKCGIAVYEAEMNLIIHTTNGGFLRVEVEHNKIVMEAYDDGPGIPDIEKAMTPGFSTATHEVRNKGFGAGMGLVNINNCVDEMIINSSPEKGTNLHMIIYLDKLSKQG
ncbi:MAG: CBS domain-containing protein [Anaerolineaceae bacterium]|jgi:CBS domain-containing protein/anti-sigma regulatory factor (Ser/Thr protein kinase)|nr:CBS domain-containing protein [Anaerolineaceae bacterium]MDD4042192.1 CBS domain-containing protein [Anaerolineaceae bacterium]MDD4577028.1 CBS domain-containing protein [Anaerolineaceae bacterium]